jgi:hypothetical protein
LMHPFFQDTAWYRSPEQWILKLRSPENLRTRVSQHYYRYDNENQTVSNKGGFTKSLSAIYFRAFNSTFEVN